jgi:hypothetical protein
MYCNVFLCPLDYCAFMQSIKCTVLFEGKMSLPESLEVAIVVTLYKSHLKRWIAVHISVTKHKKPPPSRRQGKNFLDAEKKPTPEMGNQFRGLHKPQERIEKWVIADSKFFLKFLIEILYVGCPAQHSLINLPPLAPPPARPFVCSCAVWWYSSTVGWRLLRALQKHDTSPPTTTLLHDDQSFTRFRNCEQSYSINKS